MNSPMLIVLIGGTLLLLYGVRLAGSGLREFAGKEIKSALSTLTRNRFFAFFTGIVITFLLQSSSATTVMLVSFVDSGLMQISQTIGVILGSGVGTTLTVQLISFQLHRYSLGIVGLGLFILFASKSERRKSLGEGIFGFGLIFLSIGIISETMKPLEESELFTQLLLSLGENPVLTVIASAVFTGLIQSSAGTIGLALSLSLNHLIELKTAIPIILGANIGTCATALLASLRSKSEARQVAIAHTLIKTLGVVLFLPILKPFQALVELTAQTIPHQIANAHTLFNLLIAMIFLPFTGLFQKLSQRLTPKAKEEEKEKFAPKYLNPELLSTPSLAIASATREAMRMAEIVQDMLSLSIKPFVGSESNLELIENIEAMDDKVDILDREIRFYLTQLARHPLNEEEAQRQMEILHLIHNLENIGDVIDKNLMELAKKKLRKEAYFSKEGEQELMKFHKKIYDNLVLALSAFTTRDETLAQQVIRNKQKVRELEQEFYQKHLHRLEEGMIESFETSRIHLDLLSNFKRINSYITNIAYPIVQKRGESQLRL